MTTLYSALGEVAWDRAHARLVETLRDLIRIPSVNPPEQPDAETVAARYVADALVDAGLTPRVVEPVPGRGSVVARLRGDGTGGAPLLLLAHHDVAPAPVERWTHDPFGADVAEGYIWGRGAVDMKDLLAMEIEVVRLLAEATRAAGRDPATDPVPGLRRDVILASTADEEAGGWQGLGWLVDNEPDLVRAAGAINESGGVSVTVGDRRIYPIGVAEKGWVVYQIAVRGTWGHGSMPRPDNAALLASRVVTALAEPGPIRITPTMREFFLTAAAAIEGDPGRALAAYAGDRPEAAEAAITRACEERHARVLRAVVRDTISTGIIRAGIKYNVIPGDATIVLDCRFLPDTTEPEVRAAIFERLGPELAAACTIESASVGMPVVAPAEGELWDAMAASIRAADPDGTPIPILLPFATDAKHLVRIGVPSYGFSPLRLDPAESYMERFHGIDERVSIDALRWGLPVLADTVRRFCG